MSPLPCSVLSLGPWSEGEQPQKYHTGEKQFPGSQALCGGKGPCFYNNCALATYKLSDYRFKSSNLALSFSVCGVDTDWLPCFLFAILSP